MASCKFITEMNRLRKSSSESIDSIETFDKFKGYMHVVRKAEEDLKALLRKINASRKKTLILLCGSAGDGKSHLLSYLKNLDEEHLIDTYIVYNDATESSAPLKTSVETLSEKLEPYMDDKLESPGRNIILAINLGVLSNFIESEYGKAYNALKKYVEDANILTMHNNNSEFDKDSHFQHISFSEYNMYSLTENGAHAGYIEAIMKKIFASSKDNLFYVSYEESCLLCPLRRKCPVKKNYEYLMEEKKQKYIAKLLVKAIIQDKMILTTREILNFIHDILIPSSFSYQKLQKIIDDTTYLKEFLKQITPSLLFESIDVTMLLSVFSKYDPLLIRSEQTDEDAIIYYASSDISLKIKEFLDQSIFGDVICTPEMLEKINGDKTLRSSIYNLIVRVLSIEEGDIKGETYKNYLKNLYWYNSGNSKKLRPLYEMVEKAVMQWCGSDDDGNLCLDDSHKEFHLYEKVEFDEEVNNTVFSIETDELYQFTQIVVTVFRGLSDDKIELNIDYSLYELLDKLNRGYIQTIEDRNNHAEFISFVGRILNTGTLSKSLSILFMDGKKAIISKSTFGYKFKVVK